MSIDKRGSEEPGDQILDRPATHSDSDASSKDQGHTLDAQADVAGGRFHEPLDEDDEELEDRRSEANSQKRNR